MFLWEIPSVMILFLYGFMGCYNVDSYQHELLQGDLAAQQACSDCCVARPMACVMCPKSFASSNHEQAVKQIGVGCLTRNQSYIPCGKNIRSLNQSAVENPPKNISFESAVGFSIKYIYVVCFLTFHCWCIARLDDIKDITDVITDVIKDVTGSIAWPTDVIEDDTGLVAESDNLTEDTGLVTGPADGMIEDTGLPAVSVNLTGDTGLVTGPADGMIEDTRLAAESADGMSKNTGLVHNSSNDEDFRRLKEKTWTHYIAQELVDSLPHQLSSNLHEEAVSGGKRPETFEEALNMAKFWLKQDLGVPYSQIRDLFVDYKEAQYIASTERKGKQEKIA